MMNRFVVVCICALLLAGCGGAGWSRQGNVNFSAEFPGAARDTSTIEGSLYTFRFFYEPPNATDANAYYDVSECSMPDSLENFGKNLNAYMKADAQVYAWSIDGTLSGEGTPVTNGALKGFEYVIKMPDDIGEVKLRKFAVGKKMYTLKVITPKEHLNNPDIKRFMGSFRVEKK